MTLVKVIVTLKPTLLDAQGRVVQEALHSLGYNEIQQVRIGKYMELQLDVEGMSTQQKVEERVREMCHRLLANPVIEDFTILEVAP